MRIKVDLLNKKHFCENVECLKPYYFVIYGLISKTDLIKISSIVNFTVFTKFFDTHGKAKLRKEKMASLKYLPTRWNFLSIEMLNIIYGLLFLPENVIIHIKKKSL